MTADDSLPVTADDRLPVTADDSLYMTADDSLHITAEGSLPMTADDSLHISAFILQDCEDCDCLLGGKSSGSGTMGHKLEITRMTGVTP